MAPRGGAGLADEKRLRFFHDAKATETLRGIGDVAKARDE